MKKILFIILLISCNTCLFSQFLQEKINLHKYWRYRERLKNFVVYGDGYVFARDIRITLQTPFVHPDYVFEKNYKLKSLEDIEMFIQQNGHLPNIPTASDVEKNKGINLGEMPNEKEVANEGINTSEMITKLLKQQEEIVLYIIEQNKRIELLEKESKK